MEQYETRLKDLEHTVACLQERDIQREVDIAASKAKQGMANAWNNFHHLLMAMHNKQNPQCTYDEMVAKATALTIEKLGERP